MSHVAATFCYRYYADTMKLRHTSHIDIIRFFDIVSKNKLFIDNTRESMRVFAINNDMLSFNSDTIKTWIDNNEIQFRYLDIITALYNAVK
jgi:hypothetical protein